MESLKDKSPNCTLREQRVTFKTEAIRSGRRTGLSVHTPALDKITIRLGNIIFTVDIPVMFILVEIFIRKTTGNRMGKRISLSFLRKSEY